jgi:hypothetical protein
MTSFAFLPAQKPGTLGTLALLIKPIKGRQISGRTPDVVAGLEYLDIGESCFARSL